MAQRENTERWNLDQRQADREALRLRTITVLERITKGYINLADNCCGRWNEHPRPDICNPCFDMGESRLVKEAKKLIEELKQVN